MEPILVERHGRVGLVTLNRPEKLNALNSALVNQLELALRELNADDDIGAIVITGAGERAFSAGGDMAEQVAALDESTAFECDIRIGGEDARFKFHGASYGRAPGGAVLPRIVGEAKAKELLFTGDEVSAKEALRVGLLNQMVPSGDAVEVAVAMAQRIAANSPEAVKALKEVIDLALPIEPALEHERDVNREIGRSEDSASRFRQAAERVIGIRQP